MKTIINRLFNLTISIILLSTVASAATLQIGQPAHNFSATTINGKQINLLQYIGNGIAVIEWYDPDCPFVLKHYNVQNMQQLQREYTAKGVKWIRIYSSHEGSPRYVNQEQAKALVNKRQVPTQVINILDPDGRIGRLYGAKVALYMVIIDHGKIVYTGAIDDRPSTKSQDIPSSENYVRKALNELLAGNPVSQPRTKPYGCSIKYAKN